METALKIYIFFSSLSIGGYAIYNMIRTVSIINKHLKAYQDNDISEPLPEYNDGREDKKLKRFKYVFAVYVVTVTLSMIILRIMQLWQ